MTTTLPTSSRPTVLRRPREGRVAAGVSAGFGNYFGVDPVLFRVLFATSAFFGGAGILAYVLAWVAIPEKGTERAAVDGWIAALRRRRVPVWLVAVGGGLLFWAVAASWWAPGPPLAVIAIVGVAVAGWLSRRQKRAPDAPPAVVLTKDAAPSQDSAAGEGPDGSEMRAWLRESRAARRARIRRARPVKVAILVTLGVVLAVLAVIDTAHGVELQGYFRAALGIVVVGLLVGVVLRRTPWSLLILLVPAIAGAAAFSGSAARLHDGVGQRTWTPVSAAATTTTQYRLAFGRAELDLRSVTGPARIDVTVGAGQVRIVAPRDLTLTVDARVHIGRVDVAGEPGRDSDGGVGVHRIVRPTAASSGAAVTVHVQLADGRVLVDHS